MVTCHALHCPNQALPGQPQCYDHWMMLPAKVRESRRWVRPVDRLHIPQSVRHIYIFYRMTDPRSAREALYSLESRALGARFALFATKATCFCKQFSVNGMEALQQHPPHRRYPQPHQPQLRLRQAAHYQNRDEQAVHCADSASRRRRSSGGAVFMKRSSRVPLVSQCTMSSS